MAVKPAMIPHNHTRYWIEREQMTSEEQVRYYKNKIGTNKSFRDDKFFAAGYINLTNYKNERLYYDLLDSLQKYRSYSQKQLKIRFNMSSSIFRRITNKECVDDDVFMLAVICKINPQYKKTLPEKISVNTKKLKGTIL